MTIVAMKPYANATVAYYLTKAEMKELKRRCKKANLSFHAMAARPKVAKEILNDEGLA